MKLEHLEDTKLRALTLFDLPESELNKNRALRSCIISPIPKPSSTTGSAAPSRNPPAKSSGPSIRTPGLADSTTTLCLCLFPRESMPRCEMASFTRRKRTMRRMAPRVRPQRGWHPHVEGRVRQGRLAQRSPPAADRFRTLEVMKVDLRQESERALDLHCHA